MSYQDSINEEVKFGNKETHRQTLPCPPTHITKTSANESLILMETTSEPDLTAIAYKVKSTPKLLKDDSFVLLEETVTKMESIPDTYGMENLDTTQDIVNLITKMTDTPTNTYDNYRKLSKNQVFAQDLNKHHGVPSSSSSYLTPAKHINSDQNLKTPELNSRAKSPRFYTSANPSSLNKASSSVSVKKNSSKKYQHIASPVAAYINYSPQVPLVKDVHPSKPLPSPRVLFGHNYSKPAYQVHNKENINLPTIAYRSAKIVKVIEVADVDKLPHSYKLSKAVTAPKLLVLKHDHREGNLIKKPSKDDLNESFNNLTLHQADVSVHTQKSAYNRLYK